jgi:hypothetical protein
MEASVLWLHGAILEVLPSKASRATCGTLGWWPWGHWLGTEPAQLCSCLNTKCRGFRSYGGWGGVEGAI